jgi:hypothetical protein
MTMPRLSLYRPEKGNDYKFIDKTIWEMFQVGGTDVYVHKFLGARSTPTWDSTKNYAIGDLVSIGNKVYKALAESINTSPPNANFWKFVREGTPSQPVYDNSSIFNIDDLLFLENRERDYAEDIYILRGVYNLSDQDFNLTQFGLFLQNDTIFITFHINDTVEKIGRKIIAGDVIELPHLKDDHALNELQYAIKRFYVVEEVTRAAEGFSVTWYPHLYRAKLKPMTASQEFQDILDDLINKEDPNSPTIGEANSTYEKDMSITQAILDQAEADAPKSGYDTSKFFTLQRDSNTGRAELVTVDNDTILQYSADNQTQATDPEGNLLFDDEGNPIYAGVNAASYFKSADGKGYVGYLTADGTPPNGAPFTSGIGFPPSPVDGQFCLRIDYLPNRLFRFNGSRWVKFEDNVRMTMSNLGDSDVGTGDRFEGKDTRLTQKTSFINNTTVNDIDGKTTKEKQSLSKALRPQADE